MAETRKSFEEALAELEEIVKRLEGEEIPLEEALDAFEKGVRLSRYCARCLDEAEKRIQVLTQAEDGEPRLEPWDGDDEAL